MHACDASMYDGLDSSLLPGGNLEIDQKSETSVNPYQILSLASNLKMKVSAVSMTLVFGIANAFAPQLATTQHSTQLNLFGGGGAKNSGEKKAPGMMDQLGMFKKAQELAKKKNDLDKELSEIEYMGEGADGKVKVTFKFVPVKNPMDPNPDYEAQNFAFDEEWFEGASPEEISAAVKEAIENGIKNTNDAVAKKYETLQGDLMGALAPSAPEQEEQ
jgi:DNA-binding protein YbaB